MFLFQNVVKGLCVSPRNLSVSGCGCGVYGCGVRGDICMCVCFHQT